MIMGLHTFESRCSHKYLILNRKRLYFPAIAESPRIKESGSRNGEKHLSWAVSWSNSTTFGICSGCSIINFFWRLATVNKTHFAKNMHFFGDRHNFITGIWVERNDRQSLKYYYTTHMCFTNYKCKIRALEK